MKTRILSILFVIMMVLSVFAFSACNLNGVEGPQGEQGEPGKDGKDGVDGVGIASVVKISSEGLVDTYEITYTNGTKTTFTITNGANGTDGVGICSAEVNDDGELVIHFTNNTSINLGKVVGSNGQNGENGDDGKNLTDCEHEFGEWIVDIEPSCDSIGVNYRVCAKCNEVERDYIEKTNHKYVYLYTIINNCTEHKVMEECTVCSNVRTANKEIQHDIVIDEAVPHTCTTDGLTEGSHCSICGTVIVKQEIVPAHHSEVVDKAVAPTCTATGLTEGKHCSTCGEVFVAQEVIDKVNHNYVGGVCTICGGKVTPATSDEYFTFTLLNNDTYSIKAKDVNNMPSKIVIPDIYNGKAVTSIGSYAFKGCKSLTSVVIPDSVTSIGYEAFENCSGLTSVVIGKSVASISSNVFDYCYRLVEVINHSSLKITVGGSYGSYGGVGHYALEVHNGENSKIDNVDGYLFYTYNGTNYLVNYIGNDTELTLPENYKGEEYVIHRYAFYDCSDITSVVISDSVTSIDYYAFQACTNLAEIVIPDSVASIDYEAFYNTAYYKDENNWVNEVLYIDNHLIEAKDTISGECVIKDGVVTIHNRAFSGCKSLTRVVIPSSVTTIDFDAFKNCTGLISVVIDDNSVTSIGNSAFYGCTSLTSVVIGKSVTSIGSSAFQGCTSLTEIVIPDSVNSIGNSAFYGCTSLTSVVIGKAVTSIGSSAFSGCTSLPKIVIPDSVTSIGGSAFYGCTSLTSVVIGKSVDSIGGSAFSGCKSLTSVVIPDSVTSIGYEAFENCSGLTKVYYAGSAEEWNSISISSNSFKKVTRYYYSESQPDEEGNFWHWVDGVPTIWQ